MKNNFVDTYKKDFKNDIKKNERIHREIAREIEKENNFNSYRFDPTQVNYSL